MFVAVAAAVAAVVAFTAVAVAVAVATAVAGCMVLFYLCCCGAVCCVVMFLCCLLCVVCFGDLCCLLFLLFFHSLCLFVVCYKLPDIEKKVVTSSDGWMCGWWYIVSLLVVGGRVGAAGSNGIRCRFSSSGV